MSENTRKLFVIDTNVLLYDKASIHSFPGNDVIIPIVVLDELDRFKDKTGVIGESARYVNRFLDELRTQGDLHKGVRLEDNNQTIRVELDGFDNIPTPPEESFIKTTRYQSCGWCNTEKLVWFFFFCN